MKALLVISLFLAAIQLKAQQIQEELLFNTWYLDKYSDEEQYLTPSKRELDDFIALSPDKTYEAVFEGEQESGTWMLNTNGNYVELKDASDIKGRFYIYHLSSRSLVLVFDEDEHRVWEVHYTSCK